MSASGKDTGSKQPTPPHVYPASPKPSFAPSRRATLPYPSQAGSTRDAGQVECFPVPVLKRALAVESGGAVSTGTETSSSPATGYGANVEQGDITATLTATLTAGSLVRAKYAFSPSQREDAQFDCGDVIRIRRSVNADWIDGVVVESSNWNGKSGMFPATYVEPLLQGPVHGQPGSTPTRVTSHPHISNGAKAEEDGHVSFPDRFLVFNKELQKQWPEIARLIMDDGFSAQLRKRSKRLPPVLEFAPLAVSFKAYVSTLAGTIVYLTTKDSFKKYPFYKLHLRCIKEVFGTKWFSWNKEYGAAKRIFNRSASGSVVRGVIRAAHAAIFRTSTIDDRTFTGSLRTKRDMLELFNFGIRDLRPRVFTYVITDKGFYCTECGVEFSKDLISKHAVLSNAAERVRMAGELLFYWAESDVYLIVDNGSGTYAPDRSAFAQLERLFHINLPFIRTVIMDYQDKSLSRYKERIQEFDRKKAKQQLQGKVYATQLTGIAQ